MTFEYTVLHLFLLTGVDTLKYFVVLVDIPVMNHLSKMKSY